MAQLQSRAAGPRARRGSQGGLAHTRTRASAAHHTPYTDARTSCGTHVNKGRGLPLPRALWCAVSLFVWHLHVFPFYGQCL